MTSKRTASDAFDDPDDEFALFEAELEALSETPAPAEPAQQLPAAAAAAAAAAPAPQQPTPQQPAPTATQSSAAPPARKAADAGLAASVVSSTIVRKAQVSKAAVAANAATAAALAAAASGDTSAADRQEMSDMIALAAQTAAHHRALEEQRVAARQYYRAPTGDPLAANGYDATYAGYYNGQGAASSADSAAAHATTEASGEASESRASGKKPWKKLRMAAGKVWEDKTLEEWDDSHYRIFCGDLGNEVNDDNLTAAFRIYPSFIKARVVMDKRTSKTKGYGFVSFKDADDYVRAMREMDGKYVGNRPIKLRKSTYHDRDLQVKSAKQQERKQAMLAAYSQK
ncbi:RNA recognition domain-containing protein [Capsaspora owczarzaki ATCC 30864]|uniref:RNA recognition domain-containing protein n=1 Tax=Capsaspora owczarzaki (strain ATCC 30864) TaxID=595528 RepID=A0A0D2X0N0_CAPO3|nr:RNA recognition domain-containing protein [Capsaspora owczarzaki ATCC 30864]